MITSACQSPGSPTSFTPILWSRTTGVEVGNVAAVMDGEIDAFSPLSCGKRHCGRAGRERKKERLLGWQDNDILLLR